MPSVSTRFPQSDNDNDNDNAQRRPQTYGRVPWLSAELGRKSLVCCPPPTSTPLLETNMQQPVAPSQEEGVPPNNLWWTNTVHLHIGPISRSDSATRHSFHSIPAIAVVPRVLCISEGVAGACHAYRPCTFHRFSHRSELRLPNGCLKCSRRPATRAISK